MHRLSPLLLLCLGLGLQSSSEASFNNNPMLGSVLLMMDAFDAMVDKRAEEKARKQYGAGSFGYPNPFGMQPWNYGNLPMTPWSTPPVPGQMSNFWSPPNSSWNPFPAGEPAGLDGNWATSQDTLLVIRRNMARLYFSQYEHEDYYLQRSGQWLYLRNAVTGEERQYRIHTQEHRMVLEGEEGQRLLLKRLKATDEYRQ